MNTVARAYTDGTYASRNPKFGDDNAEWKVANALKAVSKWDIPHDRIAEVGCGGGAIIRGVADSLEAQQAVGFEPMPEAYAVAKERETDKLTFRNQTIDETTEDSFDLVLCFDVFEHVEDCFAFVRNLSRLSNRFLFHIPLDLSVQMVARMKPLLKLRDSVGHIHYFSKETALATLEECGFDIVGQFYTFGGDGTYGGKIYRLLKRPRKLAFTISNDLAARWLGGWSLMVYAINKEATD